MGSLLSEYILVIGRLKSALLANLIIIVATLPQMWLTVFSLIIGRFLLGFGGGMLINTISIYMAETIPANKLSFYGTAVNFGIVVGLLITSLIQGMTLPK